MLACLLQKTSLRGNLNAIFEGFGLILEIGNLGKISLDVDGVNLINYYKYSCNCSNLQGADMRMNQPVFITVAIDNMKGEHFGFGAAANFPFFY